MQRLYCADISEVRDNYFCDNIERNYRQDCIAAKDVLITYFNLRLTIMTIML